MIVIPMLGLSSRFFSAGYTLPKYQLPLHGQSVFAHAVRSFEHYFASERFVFLVRSDYDGPGFVASELARLGIRDCAVQVFDRDTAGQAETVYLGLRDEPADEPVYVFNIDTFRPGYQKPAFIADCDGYLEVFEAPGEHWSFVAPGPDGRVLRTTEKERISGLCSDGLYYFRSRALFDQAYLEAREHDLRIKGEFYVAPLYNLLIQRGADIRYQQVARSAVVLCGTPEEYRALLAAPAASLELR
jgi:hypothetical protein